MQDYYQGMEFVQEISNLDSLIQQQKPSFSILNSDLLSIK